MTNLLKQAQAYADSIIPNANTYEKMNQKKMLIEAYLAGVNNMTKKRVWVVMEDSVYDFEPMHHMTTFDTREKALAHVKMLKERESKDCLDCGWVLEYEQEDEFCYQAEGDYTPNHYLVSIWEQEVE